MTGSQAIVHCVRIGHCLSSLGHGASDGKQLPHDYKIKVTEHLQIGLIFKLTLCVRLLLVYKRLQSFP